MKWVVDASVAAKWLAPEPESAQADELLDDDLMAPDLIFAEVANILWKKQARGEMAVATVAAAARWLLQAPLRVVSSADLMRDALSLSMRLQHPACDCFYLALAMRQDCGLITADKRLHQRCQQRDAIDFGPRTAWLAEQPSR